jgi:hypothetical protein
VIVFDLKCSRHHVFEAWFDSSEAYDDQRARGLVQCPLCDCVEIAKAVMAPAVGPKGNRNPGPANPDAAAKSELARLAALQADVEGKCDYVGQRFADEARARHGKEDARGIYGETSLASALDLVAEGIPVAPLPFRPRRLSDA